MGFIKKIFNKKEIKDNGLKVLHLFGEYNEKDGKLTITNKNKELEQALADTATTYIETLTSINQMSPTERKHARQDAREQHNEEIKGLRNNNAALLLQKYQNKYKDTEREYAPGQERLLERGYEYLQRDILNAREMGLDDMLLIYVDEDNRTMETLVSLDDIDLYLCDEYILDMKGSFCPALGELEP